MSPSAYLSSRRIEMKVIKHSTEFWIELCKAASSSLGLTTKL